MHFASAPAKFLRQILHGRLFVLARPDESGKTEKTTAVNFGAGHSSSAVCKCLDVPLCGKKHLAEQKSRKVVLITVSGLGLFVSFPKREKLGQKFTCCDRVFVSFKLLLTCYRLLTLLKCGI